MNEKNNKGSRLLRSEQYDTVDELIERSQASFSYYLMLILSSLVIGSGILLGNSAIIIGGMVITPVLTPLICIALGIAVGKIALIRQVSLFLLKSFLIIVASGLVLAIFFGHPSAGFVFENTARTALLYFVVALASGAAASFAWTKKDISDILPGVAVSVSVVPPLCLVGIGLSALNPDITRFYLFVFLLNSFGIIIGGLVIFSLLKFHRAEDEVSREVENAYGKEISTDEKTKF
ncbi:MAG: DUF389 domain-containing protein [Candidatus Moraniibacteriota bacterium]